MKEAVEGDSQWDLALELEASRIEKQREAELEREDIDALAELEDVLGVGGGSGGGAGGDDLGQGRWSIGSAERTPEEEEGAITDALTSDDL